MDNTQESKDSVDRSDLISGDGKNSKTVVCQRCGSKVLCPGMAVLAQKELFLPSMRKKSGLSGTTEGSVDGDTLATHWFVEDMFDFENVGFTNDVGRIKYLICADCEIGPIGWHCLDDKKSFYVALERSKKAKNTNGKFTEVSGRRAPDERPQQEEKRRKTSKEAEEKRARDVFQRLTWSRDLTTPLLDRQQPANGS